MKGDVQRETLTFAGPPRAAAAHASLDASVGRIVPVTLSIEGRVAGYRADVRRSGDGGSEIRLHLPSETPPGRYGGHATVGGEQRKVVVLVEPHSRLRVRPEETVVSAAAGAHVDFSIELINAGNVVFDVPKVGTFDLNASEGQDRALGRALRARLEPDERRVDRFFEELREMHGGEARIEVMSGAGAVEPGTSRELRCRLNLPDMMRPGSSYEGTWDLDSAMHTIIVAVTDAAPRTRGRTVQ
ncbi:hypothetical protein BH23GEM9_BH23GEM9_19640 [soil metagenome]